MSDLQCIKVEKDVIPQSISNLPTTKPIESKNVEAKQVTEVTNLNNIKQVQESQKHQIDSSEICLIIPQNVKVVETDGISSSLPVSLHTANYIDLKSVTPRLNQGVSSVSSIEKSSAEEVKTGASLSNVDVNQNDENNTLQSIAKDQVQPENNDSANGDSVGSVEVKSVTGDPKTIENLNIDSFIASQIIVDDQIEPENTDKLDPPFAIQCKQDEIEVSQINLPQENDTLLPPTTEVFPTIPSDSIEMTVFQTTEVPAEATLSVDEIPQLEDVIQTCESSKSETDSAIGQVNEDVIHEIEETVVSQSVMETTKSVEGNFTDVGKILNGITQPNTEVSQISSKTQSDPPILQINSETLEIELDTTLSTPSNEMDVSQNDELSISESLQPKYISRALEISQTSLLPIDASIPYMEETLKNDLVILEQVPQKVGILDVHCETEKALDLSTPVSETTGMAMLPYEQATVPARLENEITVENNTQACHEFNWETEVLHQENNEATKITTEKSVEATVDIKMTAEASENEEDKQKELVGETIDHVEQPIAEDLGLSNADLVRLNGLMASSPQIEHIDVNAIEEASSVKFSDKVSDPSISNPVEDNQTETDPSEVLPLESSVIDETSLDICNDNANISQLSKVELQSIPSYSLVENSDREAVEINVRKTDEANPDIQDPEHVPSLQDSQSAASPSRTNADIAEAKTPLDVLAYECVAILKERTEEKPTNKKSRVKVGGIVTRSKAAKQSQDTKIEVLTAVDLIEKPKSSVIFMDATTYQQKRHQETSNEDSTDSDKLFIDDKIDLYDEDTTDDGLKFFQTEFYTVPERFLTQMDEFRSISQEDNNLPRDGHISMPEHLKDISDTETVNSSKMEETIQQLSPSHESRVNAPTNVTVKEQATVLISSELVSETASKSDLISKGSKKFFPPSIEPCQDEIDTSTEDNDVSDKHLTIIEDSLEGVDIDNVAKDDTLKSREPDVTDHVVHDSAKNKEHTSKRKPSKSEIDSKSRRSKSPAHSGKRRYSSGKSRTNDKEKKSPEKKEDKTHRSQHTEEQKKHDGLSGTDLVTQIQDAFKDIRIKSVRSDNAKPSTSSIDHSSKTKKRNEEKKRDETEHEKYSPKKVDITEKRRSSKSPDRRNKKASKLSRRTASKSPDLERKESARPSSRRTHSKSPDHKNKEGHVSTCKSPKDSKSLDKDSSKSIFNISTKIEASPRTSSYRKSAKEDPDRSHKTRSDLKARDAEPSRKPVDKSNKTTTNIIIDEIVPDKFESTDKVARESPEKDNIPRKWKKTLARISDDSHKFSKVFSEPASSLEITDKTDDSQAKLTTKEDNGEQKVEVCATTDVDTLSLKRKRPESDDPTTDKSKSNLFINKELGRTEIKEDNAKRACEEPIQFPIEPSPTPKENWKPTNTDLTATDSSVVANQDVNNVQEIFVPTTPPTAVDPMVPAAIDEDVIRMICLGEVTPVKVINANNDSVLFIPSTNDSTKTSIVAVTNEGETNYSDPLFSGSTKDKNALNKRDKVQSKEDDKKEQGEGESVFTTPLEEELELFSQFAINSILGKANCGEQIEEEARQSPAALDNKANFGDQIEEEVQQSPAALDNKANFGDQIEEESRQSPADLTSYPVGNQPPTNIIDPSIEPSYNYQPYTYPIYGYPQGLPTESSSEFNEIGKGVNDPKALSDLVYSGLYPTPVLPTTQPTNWYSGGNVALNAQPHDNRGTRGINELTEKFDAPRQPMELAVPTGYQGYQVSKLLKETSKVRVEQVEQLQPTNNNFTTTESKIHRTNNKAGKKPEMAIPTRQRNWSRPVTTKSPLKKNVPKVDPIDPPVSTLNASEGQGGLKVRKNLFDSTPPTTNLTCDERWEIFISGTNKEKTNKSTVTEKIKRSPITNSPRTSVEKPSEYFGTREEPRSREVNKDEKDKPIRTPAPVKLTSPGQDSSVNAVKKSSHGAVGGSKRSMFPISGTLESKRQKTKPHHEIGGVAKQTDSSELPNTQSNFDWQAFNQFFKPQ